MIEISLSLLIKCKDTIPALCTPFSIHYSKLFSLGKHTLYSNLLQYLPGSLYRKLVNPWLFTMIGWVFHWFDFHEELVPVLQILQVNVFVHSGLVVTLLFLHNDGCRLNIRGK